VNNKFKVTPSYISHKIQMLENAIAGLRHDLSKLTHQMQIDAHAEQIRLYEKKLTENKARLAAMEAAAA
jgi:hypothetical protein